MNWGLKIILAYLAFVSGILVLVFKANSSHFDLVEPRYYEAELAFQDRIDASRRTAALAEPLQLVSENGQIKIFFPASISGKMISGRGLIYYPADARRDTTIEFTTRDSVVLHTGAKAKGWHRIKLSWEVGRQMYYYETGIHL